LSDKLPESKIDFEQGGNLRKQDEACSIYKLICIAICIPSFKKEIQAELSKYNFVNFAFDNLNSNTYASARALLMKLEELDSLRINSIISAANISISQISEKKRLALEVKAISCRDCRIGLSI
jgi:hypothetical protein